MDFLIFQVRVAIFNNYKDSRLIERGQDYVDMKINSALEDIKKDGYFIIGNFESKSGLTIKYKLDKSNILMEE